MTELRTQLDAARAAHHQGSYPGDLADEVLAPDEAPHPVLLRIFYAAGALATAAALTFGVMRFGGSMTGGEPDQWRRQLADLGDRGRALVMSVSAGLPQGWDLPEVSLPRMSRPSEFPQHLRMMSPINRVRKPELPDGVLPGQQPSAPDAAQQAA